MDVSFFHSSNKKKSLFNSCHTKSIMYKMIEHSFPYFVLSSFKKIGDLGCEMKWTDGKSLFLAKYFFYHFLFFINYYYYVFLQ